MLKNISSLLSLLYMSVLIGLCYFQTQITVIIKHILENKLEHKNSPQLSGIDAMMLSFVRSAVI